MSKILPYILVYKQGGYCFITQHFMETIRPNSLYELLPQVHNCDADNYVLAPFFLSIDSLLCCIESNIHPQQILECKI